MNNTADANTGREPDLSAVDKRLLASVAFQIYLIRDFEQTLLRLMVDDCIHGPVHTSIGQEACAAGAMAALAPHDIIASTHRAHHHYLSKILSFYSSSGFDILAGEMPENIQREITTLLGEVMGLSIGCCGGRGGSMHLRNPRIGVFGTNAIVAGGVPASAGAAFAAKYKNSGDIVVCFIGDGAVNQGAFHETMNLASLWKLPVVYFIENNYYAVATSVERSTVGGSLANKAAAHEMRSAVVDGMDPVSVMQAVQEAAQYAREGKGPTLLEAQCYRYLHHAGPSTGSAYDYRAKEEEEQWRKRDPHTVFPQLLIDNKILTENQLEQLQALAQEMVNTSVAACTIYREGKNYVLDELWPDPELIDEGLRAGGGEFDGITFSEIEQFSEFETVTYVEAIAAVIGKHLEQDETVFVMGEEVASFGGGAYAATKGLPEKYPDRVINTPISECGFTGLCGGAAMAGLKPIVEIMFPDFVLVAADQVFNQIGKLRHMYGNTTDMQLIARTRVAIGCGYGGQHSGDPVGIFSLFSGWHIIAPSNAFDYIGLFNSAMRCRDPVLIVEHNTLYQQKSEVPKDNLDYFIPLGSAKVVTVGDDITVLCYSSTVDLVVQAAEDLKKRGIAVETIDLRTLDLMDIDYNTIGRSLKKTGLLAIVEQAPASAAIGPRIASECQNRFFDYLDGPITTLSARDIPLPVSKVLEAAALPSRESVRNALYTAATRNT